MKPHMRTFLPCLLLVLAATALDLYRPILIGNAIDRFITGDFLPGEAAAERFAGVLKAAGIYLVVLLLLFLCTRFQFLMMQKMGQDIIYSIRNGPSPSIAWNIYFKN